MNLKKLSFSLLATALSLLIIFFVAYVSLHQTKKVEAQTSPTPGIFTMSGYAWSSNIGWISMSGTTATGGTYGVSFDSTGQPTSNSYAWSSNIGWLDFGPNGCGPDTGSSEVVYNPSNQSFSGSAQFLSAGGDGTGWDGCVSMSGSAGTTTYGMKLGSGVSITSGTTTYPISGYLWGSNVVGWIDMSQATMTIASTTPPTTCQTNSDCTGGETCNLSTGTCVSPTQTCPDGVTPTPPDCPVNSGNTTLATPTATSCPALAVALSVTTNANTGTLNIYREIGNGGFSLLNSQPIYASQNGRVGYSDASVLQGNTYTYYAEVIEDAYDVKTPSSQPITVSSQTCPTESGATLNITPSIIQAEGSCNVGWNITSASPDDICTLSGGGSSNPINVLLGTYASSTFQATGTTTTGALQQTESYTLSCVGSSPLSITKSCKVEDIHEF